VSEFVLPQRWRDARGRSAEAAVDRDRLEGELRRELARGHVLFGQAARAVGWCRHCDDAIFELPDGGFAIVHLTWPSSGPDRPPWPDTELHADSTGIEAYLREHDDR